MYAYTPDVGNVTIKCEIQEEPQQITITFIDGGLPYNPLEKPDPDITIPIRERQIGGYGIFLVKKNMDGVFYQYQDGKNMLTIKKNL